MSSTNESIIIELLRSIKRLLGGSSASTPIDVSISGQPIDVEFGGSTSIANTTTTPLSGAATYTGTGEQNDYPHVMIYSYSDVAGTLYFDWSVDGTNWHAFPTSGYACSAGVPEFHTAVKGGRYFRARYVNGSSAQSTFRLTTYFGDNFLPISSPLNQSIGLDGDSTAVRPNDFYDEVSRGLRDGVSKWNLFAYTPAIAAASGEVPLWASSTTTFTPLSSAETFTITYDGTGGGSTDGSGTTGATQLTFYYIDSNGSEAVATHNLETDGSDVTSFSGFGINRVAVSDNGGLTYNANNITITATSSGTEQAFIPATKGSTQGLILFVGTDRRANVKWLHLGANKLSGSNPKVTFIGYVYNRSIDGRFEVFRHVMDTQSQTSESFEDPVGFTLNPTDVFYIVADTDTNSTIASGRMSAVTYQTS